MNAGGGGGAGAAGAGAKATGGGATAARLVAIAYLATAALVVLQTFVLRAVAYDAPGFDRLAGAFRVAFVLADVTLLAAMIALGWSARALRAFAIPGAVLVAFAVLSGAAGLLLGSKLTAATSGAEPLLSLGAALLVVLALSASARDLARAPSLAVLPSPAVSPRLAAWSPPVILAAAAIAIAFRFARAASPGARGVTLAWISWGFEVARPLALGLFALVLARAIGARAKAEAHASGAGAAGGASGAGAGPPAAGAYRAGAPDPAVAAGDAASTAAAVTPPEPATVPALRAAVSGLSLYRLGFLIRLGLAILTTLIAGVVLSANARDGWPALVLGPLAGAATAVIMALGVARQLGLPTLRANGRLVAALVALGLTALADALTVLAELAAGVFGTGRYSTFRDVSQAYALGYPTSMLFFGVAAVLVAGALGRAGETLSDPVTTARARWAQGLAVTTGSLLLGLLFGLAAGASRHGRSVETAAIVVGGVLFLGAAAAPVAFVVTHLLVVSGVLGTLRARLSLAS